MTILTWCLIYAIGFAAGKSGMSYVTVYQRGAVQPRVPGRDKGKAEARRTGKAAEGRCPHGDDHAEVPPAVSVQQHQDRRAPADGQAVPERKGLRLEGAEPGEGGLGTCQHRDARFITPEELAWESMLAP